MLPPDHLNKANIMSRPFGYSGLFSPKQLHYAFYRNTLPEAKFCLGNYESYFGKRANRVMDLQCGPGLSTVAFSSEAPETIGVDSEPDMVSYAKSLNPDNKITWICDHPLTMSKQRDIDLLFFSLDSYAYLLSDEDELLFWSNMNMLLSKQGMAVIEINNSSNIGYIDYSTVYNAPKSLFADYQLRVEWGINDPKTDLITGVCSTEIRFTESDDQNIKSWTVLSPERYHWPRDINLILQLSGFKTIRFCGDYDSSYLEPTSPRVVFIAVRR